MFLAHLEVSYEPIQHPKRPLGLSVEGRPDSGRLNKILQMQLNSARFSKIQLDSARFQPNSAKPKPARISQIHHGIVSFPPLFPRRSNGQVALGTGPVLRHGAVSHSPGPPTASPGLGDPPRAARSPGRIRLTNGLGTENQKVLILFTINHKHHFGGDLSLCSS